MKDKLSSLTTQRLRLLYYGEKLSQTQIAKQYGCHQLTVSHRMKQWGLPARTFSEAGLLNAQAKRLKSPRVNLDMSPDLAYILGVLKGDGYCFYANSRDSIIGLDVNDADFAYSFAHSLRAIGFYPSVRDTSKYSYSHTKYRVIVYDYSFVDWYEGLMLPEIKLMLEPYRELTLQFFRGIYESEGTFAWTNKRWSCQLRIVNTNRRLLIMLRELMRRQNYDFVLSEPRRRRKYIGATRVIRHKKAISTLSLNKRQQVKELLEAIQPAIGRKRWAEKDK